MSYTGLWGQQSNSFSDYLSKPVTYNIFFSYAQISDTHIYVENKESCEYLNTIVDEINADENIAFVIVTGDITEYGDYASFVKAKSILERLKCQYYVVPGNNDYELSSASGENFKKVFRDNKFRLLFNGYLFLGINTSSPYRWSEGHIAAHDIVWVKQQLKNVGRKTPVFIVTHHPLKDGDVNNWFSLTDEVRKYNIQSIISGHYHRNMINEYDGILGFVSKAAVSQNAVLGYTKYQLTDDSLYVFDKTIGKQPVLWASQALTQKFYVEGDISKFPRPDFAINSDFKNVKEKWHKNVDVDIFTAAVANETNVYFSDCKGNFRCLSLKNGKENWVINVGSAVYKISAIVQGKIVFGTMDNIYCVEVKNGRIAWKIASKGAVFHEPVVAQGIVYISNEDNLLKSINLSSGELIWSKHVNLIQYSKLSVYNGVLYVGSLDGHVFALRASDGEFLWERKIGNNDELKAYSASRSAESGLLPIGNKLFYVSVKGDLNALDLYTGKLLWQSKGIKLMQSVGVSRSNTILYCRTYDGKIFAIDTQSNDFNIVWQIDNVYANDTNVANIVCDDNYLYLSTYDGEIISVDVNKHKVAWRHKVGVSSANRVCLVDTNRCVITTLNGDVVLLSY